MLSNKECFEETLKYFDGDELAADVFINKYALRDSEENILEKTPAEMHRRLAREFARIEAKKFKHPMTEDEIFSYLDHFKFISPQGGPLTAIGNPYKLMSISNCFVLEPPLDSYGGIHRTDEQLSQISKRRGGCGIDISHLRPDGSSTANSSKTSSGIVPFLERYSNSIREVGQGGRRGALMITISVHHPQVLDFARVKLDLKKVTGANISVRLTDEFLNAVKKGEKYEQRWPVEGTPKISKMVDAREVWFEIIKCAHKMAEPGLLFWDNILRESPADCYWKFGFRTISTNPCLRGNTKVLTNNGWITLKELVNKNHSELKVKNINEEWCKFDAFPSGNKKLWKIKTKLGEIYCTAEHKWPHFRNMIGTPFLLSETSKLIEGDCLLTSDWSKLPIWIESIEETNIYEDVYEISIHDKTHTFTIENNIITGNCSELPLCILDSCRLLIENLFSFVENPFTPKARFNFAKFYQYTKIAQRLMDDLVDIEIEQIDKILEKIKQDPEPDIIKATELDLWTKIREKCINGRRTGLGPTGLADTIAALGIKYGSQESIDLTDKIYKTMKLGAYASSVEMAKELGPFPVWDHELEKDNPFLNRIQEEKIEFGEFVDIKNSWDIVDNFSNSLVEGFGIWVEMKKYGRRNIALLTSAPVGSLSIETQTTSAIEPLFSPSYTRRKKINHNDKDSRVDFTDASGDKWQEFEIYHPKLKLWMDITGEKDWKKSPYFGSCAEDLDWKQRVKLQGAAQKHIDHAISSTINLPEDVTVEQVAEIYEEAWKSGLKGITVYRKNCRDGVLVEKKNVLFKNNAPSRPKEVPCDVFHVSVKGKKYFVLVGLYGDLQEPYELFAGRGDLIDESVKKGKILKFRTNFYKAVLEDETELSPITLGCSEQEEAITRLASLSLRHGTSPEFVMEQMLKINGDFTSFAKAIARSLKKYIKEGAKSGYKCPNCDINFIYENGCNICKSCGLTKCN